MFKFKLRQKVKVQVFNIVTTGEVVERHLRETKKFSVVKYTVKFGDKSGDLITVGEGFLDETQYQPIGVL